MTEETISLIRQREQLEQALANLVFGAIEVRDESGNKSVYVHSRISGKQVTKYVGKYSPELVETLTSNNQRAKELKKSLRQVNHRLNALGYTNSLAITPEILRNIDFAKRHLALTIHSQAILEGVATTFASTEDIIDGAKVTGMSATDIQKILNMKHAWEFILDQDVILSDQNLGLLQQINKLVEEGFYYNAGNIRDVPVVIGGTSWAPALPIKTQVQENLSRILESSKSKVDKAIDLMLYVQRTQIFLDGNKRTAVIFANHYLIANGLGLLFVPEDKVEEYKKLLIAYYETGVKKDIAAFIKTYCLLQI